jgi:hypothetical protein
MPRAIAGFFSLSAADETVDAADDAFSPTPF